MCILTVRLLPSYLQAAPVRATGPPASAHLEGSCLGQLPLHPLLLACQHWIRAARKEPVILNQFCATGRRGGGGEGERERGRGGKRSVA